MTKNNHLGRALAGMHACMHYVFIYLFTGCAGLGCHTDFFSTCSKWGLLSSCGAWTSHCSSFSSCLARALGHAGFSGCGSQPLEQGLNSCDTGAWLLHTCGIFPDQGGIKPVSPASAGRFFTTEQPRKPAGTDF